VTPTPTFGPARNALNSFGEFVIGFILGIALGVLLPLAVGFLLKETFDDHRFGIALAILAAPVLLSALLAARSHLHFFTGLFIAAGLTMIAFGLFHSSISSVPAADMH